MTSQNERKAWMSLLAKSPVADLKRLWEAFDGAQSDAQSGAQPDAQSHVWLRAPEIGGVMVRGRAGATGAPFNLGEMTVTRCSLKLPGGEVGHGYVQGRDKDHATRAALIDAHMQSGQSAAIRRHVLDPLKDLMSASKEERARKAAATKVDFFTLARGED
ncbi:MAG: phosphonate C-P lyase system protein PhnG [Pseudomonadota bacterium]